MAHHANWVTIEYFCFWNSRSFLSVLIRATRCEGRRRGASGVPRGAAVRRVTHLPEVALQLLQHFLGTADDVHHLLVVLLQRLVLPLPLGELAGEVLHQRRSPLLQGCRVEGFQDLGEFYLYLRPLKLLVPRVPVEFQVRLLRRARGSGAVSAGPGPCAGRPAGGNAGPMGRTWDTRDWTRVARRARSASACRSVRSSRRSSFSTLRHSPNACLATMPIPMPTRGAYVSALHQAREPRDLAAVDPPPSPAGGAVRKEAGDDH